MKVLDFGLARLASAVETAEGLTPLGTVIGTPGYMAPEQVFSPHQTDTRADIYSLGCTLYHLLAGRPPFAGVAMQKLLSHQQQPAPLIREVRKDVPVELEAVLQKMMAKDPAYRYQTPAEVGTALAPFARGERVSAAPHGRWRRPVLGAGVLALLALLGGLGWLLLHKKDTGRGEEPGELRVIGGKEFGPFNRVAFSPDCRLALSGNPDFSVGLWDLDAGKEVARLKGHTNKILALAFSPSGALALSGGQDQAICLWDVRERKLVKKIEGHTAWVRGLAFAPDEWHAVAGDNFGAVLEWDLDAGKVRKTLQPARGGPLVWCVAVSATGSKALSGGWDEKVTVWDLREGRRLATLTGHKQTVSCVAFSPDGRHVLSGSADTTVRFWSLETYKEERRFEGHEGGLNGIALSGDGRRLMSAANDGTLRLWDVASGKQVYSFTGHGEGIVLGVAFLPDRRRAISGGRDGTFRIWRLPSPD